MKIIQKICSKNLNGEQLKSAIEMGKIQPFNEIEFFLKNGTLTCAVCGGRVGAHTRFLMKTPIGYNFMNYTATNKGSYYNSEGRYYVNEFLSKLFLKDLEEIITPRHFEEDGYTYDDKFWIPSVFDIFSHNKAWPTQTKDVYMGIFSNKQDRQLGSDWWLRSPAYIDENDKEINSFFVVDKEGELTYRRADNTCGYVIGFDI